MITSAAAMKATFVFLIVIFSVGQCWAEISTDRVNYRQLLFGDIGTRENLFSEEIINEVLDFYVIHSENVENKLCRNQSLFYLESIKSNVSWALRMLDASSKVPDGLFMGNNVHMGHYDECAQIRDVPSDFGKFHGQYCSVLIGRPGEKPNKIRPFRYNLFREFKDVKRIITTMEQQMSSLCVPSSCRANDVIDHLQNVFRNLTVRVDDVTCIRPKTGIVLSNLDWIAIAGVLFTVLLLTASTLYDLVSSKSESRSDLLLSFSVIKNVKQLFSRSSPPDSLRAVEGVRTLSLFWVIALHQIIVYATMPQVNSTVIADTAMNLSNVGISNATLSVDSFFVLSGILVCYNFMKKMDSNIQFNLFTYYTRRIFRLTPAYAVAILLTITLSASLGEGPTWDNVYSHEKELCLKYWWSSLLYLNNYVGNVGDMCFGHGWYLSVDMQLYVLSPALLYPLWRWPKVGKSIIGILMISGLVITFLISYLGELRHSELNTEYYRKIYVPTHTRYTTWLIGVGLGYLLYKIKNARLNISRMQVIVGWTLSAALMLTSLMLGHHFNQVDREYDRVLDSLYISLKRPAWALGLAWMIFACLNGYGGFINSFLSWTVFQVLGRLSYSMYLLHFGAIMIFATIPTTAAYWSNLQHVGYFISFCSISIIFATTMAISIEKPFIAIERHLFSQLDSSRKPSER